MARVNLGRFIRGAEGLRLRKQGWLACVQDRLYGVVLRLSVV